MEETKRSPAKRACTTTANLKTCKQGRWDCTAASRKNFTKSEESIDTQVGSSALQAGLQSLAKIFAIQLERAIIYWLNVRPLVPGVGHSSLCLSHFNITHDITAKGHIRHMATLKSERRGRRSYWTDSKWNEIRNDSSRPIKCRSKWYLEYFVRRQTQDDLHSPPLDLRLVADLHFTKLLTYSSRGRMVWPPQGYGTGMSHCHCNTPHVEVELECIL